MNKKAILEHNLPSELEKIIRGYDWEVNSIGCSKTEVYKLVKKNQTAYLKINKPESNFNLEKENAVLRWLEGKLPVPKVIFFSRYEDREYLLISEIQGKASFEASSDEVKRQNIKILAEGLKKIHGMDPAGCPISNTPDILIQIAKSKLESKEMNNSKFDKRWRDKSPEELYQEILKNKPKEFDLVFSHGDYCLPNIIIENGDLNGFIDWSYGGINDRYFDFAAVAWSIGYNFGEEWIKYFFEDYGVEEIDWNRLRFFQMLNEFFQISE
ncbi:MAG: APH(3') family aminoglycoside O-phosphotransferase [Candidatus Heimdallarchaeaceae archaeon]|jgi:aminoglycoside phosphotransferase